MWALGGGGWVDEIEKTPHWRFILPLLCVLELQACPELAEGLVRIRVMSGSQMGACVYV